MNMQFKSKFLQHLAKKKSNKGFTLIELLVVVIIIGVLAAIALPNLLGQVAKGRQAEAKNNLGSLNRAQQAYRLDKAQFGVIADLPVAVSGQYYAFADDGAGANATSAAFKATALTDFNNDIRDYGASVGQTAAGAFNQVVCEAKLPTTAFAGSTNGTTCGANFEAVK